GQLVGDFFLPLGGDFLKLQQVVDGQLRMSCLAEELGDDEVLFGLGQRPILVLWLRRSWLDLVLLLAGNRSGNDLVLVGAGLGAGCDLVLVQGAAHSLLVQVTNVILAAGRRLGRGTATASLALRRGGLLGLLLRRGGLLGFLLRRDRVLGLLLFGLRLLLGDHLLDFHLVEPDLQQL